MARPSNAGALRDAGLANAMALGTSASAAVSAAVTSAVATAARAWCVVALGATLALLPQRAAAQGAAQVAAQGAAQVAAQGAAQVAAQVAAQATDLRAYELVGDTIPQPLTATPGDAARGRAIVADRRAGLCLLCHSGPIPEERAQGNLAPSLAGAGSRYSAAQLRLRIVDARRLNPDTIMPPAHRVDGLAQVGAAWRGRPLLSAQQVEDVVAYLATLKE